MQVVSLSYGMESENPMDRVLFYKKENRNEAFLILREEVTTDTYAFGRCPNTQKLEGAQTTEMIA